MARCCTCPGTGTRRSSSARRHRCSAVADCHASFVCRPIYGNTMAICWTSSIPHSTRDYMANWTQHYGQLAGQNFASRLSFIDQRAEYVVDRITTRDAPPVEFAVTTAGPLVVDNTVATVEGTGWVNVRDIRLDGSDSTPCRSRGGHRAGRVADTWQVEHSGALRFAPSHSRRVRFSRQSDPVRDDSDREHRQRPAAGGVPPRQ